MSIQPPVEMSSNTPAESSTTRQPLVRPLYVFLGIAAILIVAGLFIWGMVWLASRYAPSIEALRDVFIIILALESCLFGIVLMILLVMVIRLVNMLEFEIKPILEKTNETMGTIQGTTRFMSYNLVQPVTKAQAQVAGIRRALRTLFGDPRRNLEE